MKSNKLGEVGRHRQASEAGLEAQVSAQHNKGRKEGQKLRADLGSIASAVKGVKLCQLCEQKAPLH